MGDLWIAVAGAIFLGVAIVLPGLLRDIPNWAWAVAGIAFMVGCLADLWRRGHLKTFVKRGAVALLFLVPAMALISLLPGEEGDRDLPLAWVVVLVVLPSAILLVIGLRTSFFKGLQEMFASRSRPKACERCGTATEQTHYLDETWRGWYGRGARAYLCADCLRGSLANHLGVLRNRCALAEPASKPKRYHNAYYGYTESREDMALASGAGDDEDTEAATAALRRILDLASGSYRRCGQSLSNVVWIPGLKFRDSWTQFDLTKIQQEVGDLQPLCGACATQAVTQALIERKIRLDEIWAPVDGTVLMFSGES